MAEIVRRLAIAHPAVRFTLEGDHLTAVAYPPEARGEHGFLRRLAAGARPRFNDNAVPIDVDARGLALTGFAGLPTFHRGASTHVHFVVNGRPVRDKLLLGAVRGAYADVMPSDRHPVLALAIELDPRRVDVNVHPAKTEVRFRDPALVRGLVVAALKEAIARSGFRAATTGGARTLDALRPASAPPPHPPLVAARAPVLPLRQRLRRLAGADAGFRRGARQPSPTSPRPRPTPGRAPASRRRRCAARRRPRAAARDLHRRPDRGTASSSSTSTPRTSASSTSA